MSELLHCNHCGDLVSEDDYVNQLCPACLDEQEQRVMDSMEEFDDEELNCWACYGCGHTEGKRPMGGICPNCMGYMEEEFL